MQDENCGIYSNKRAEKKIKSQLGKNFSILDLNKEVRK